MNTASPLVSVVIPCYNRSAIIERTIQSVINQTEKNFEIIIVDDCSDDIEKLRSILLNYNNHNIRLIEHSVNQHGGAARNTGILAAKGTYTALLDSDDVWMPEKLTLAIEQCKHKKDVIYSQVDGFNYIFPLKKKHSSEPVSDYLICHGGGMQSSTLVLHTSFAQAVLFNPKLTRFQDLDFAIRLEQQDANFHFIDQVLVKMHDDGDTRITKGTDYHPALYWLNNAHLTQKSRQVFYANQVVPLLIASGQKHQIFDLMPTDIHNHLSIKDRIKLTILELIPKWAHDLSIKQQALLKNILPTKTKKTLKKLYSAYKLKRSM